MAAFMASTMKLDAMLDEDLEDPGFVPWSTDAILRSIVCEAVRSELRSFGEGPFKRGLKDLRDCMREDLKKELGLTSSLSKIRPFDGAATQPVRAAPKLLQFDGVAMQPLRAPNKWLQFDRAATLDGVGERSWRQHRPKTCPSMVATLGDVEELERARAASKIWPFDAAATLDDVQELKMVPAVSKIRPPDGAAALDDVEELKMVRAASKIIHFDGTATNGFSRLDGLPGMLPSEDKDIFREEFSRKANGWHSNWLPDAKFEALEDDGPDRNPSDALDKNLLCQRRPSIRESREFQALARTTGNLDNRIVGQKLQEADRRSLSAHFFKEVATGTMSCRDIVTSMAFDNITGLIIVVNAVTIGLQTDHMAAHTTDTVPLPLEVVDKVLAVYFVVELLLRLWVWRLEFFVHAKDWSWNVFDFLLVVMQAMEEGMRIFVAIAQVDGADLNSLRIMRVMRVLRLIRVIRVVRIMRLINELRTIIASVLGSLKALFWTVVLLMLLMYSVGIYFCQTVTDHRVDLSPEPVQDVFLERYSSVGVSIYTLYMAVSGGVDWQALSDPLFEHIATLPGVIFVLYIAFVLLCIMNVVTGVFVESALKNAHMENETCMIRVLKKFFVANDVDQNGKLSWGEFSQAVESADMNIYFRSIDLDPSDAVNLFRLIDVEDTGEVDLMDFVSHCTRLRGMARAIDVMTNLYESRKLARVFLLHSERVENQLDTIEHTVVALHSKLVKGVQ